MLTVTTTDVTRQEGKPNPEFILYYRGFVNGENEHVLTKVPVVTTTATESSPVGEYEIIISGGEAQNYRFTYKKGKLTIATAAGIENANAILLLHHSQFTLFRVQKWAPQQLFLHFLQAYML